MKKFDIEITKKPQLIDLNDSEKNFQIKFKVVTENEEDFLAIVLNKEELDKYSDLNEVEMKKSPGIIKGTLECNEDKTENYFLVVKKEGDPCKATVEIDINEIEKFVEIDEEYNSDQQRIVKENSVNVLFNKYFYHILGFLIVLSLVYYFYSTKKTIFVTSSKSASPSGGPSAPSTPSGGPSAPSTPSGGPSAPSALSGGPSALSGGPSAPSVSTVVPPPIPELGTTTTLTTNTLSSPSPSILSEGCPNVSTSIQKGLSILEKLETR